MTPEGIVLWITGLILVPLFTGQLRQFLAGLGRQGAALLAMGVALVLAILVQVLFGGGLHLPGDFADLVKMATIVFGLAQIAYNLLFKALPASVQARLIG